MFILWPSGVRHDDFILFLSDAVPYMAEAASTIKVSCSKIMRISDFPIVDKFVAKVKQIFLKTSSRILLFKKEALCINLPPQAIVTKWGSWINIEA